MSNGSGSGRAGRPPTGGGSAGGTGGNAGTVVWFDTSLLIDIESGALKGGLDEVARMQKDGFKMLLPKHVETEFLFSQQGAQNMTKRQAFLQRFGFQVDNMASQVPLAQVRAWTDQATTAGLGHGDAKMVAHVRASAHVRNIKNPVLLSQNTRDFAKMRLQGVSALKFEPVAQVALRPKAPIAVHGGGAGPSQQSPGRLRQGLRIAGYAGTTAVGFLLTLLLGGTIARLQESSMQRQRNALEPRIRADFRHLKEQAIRLLVAGKEAHLVLHFKTSSLDVHMGPGGGWSDTWPKLEYLGMEIRVSPVGRVEADGKTKWVLVRYDRGGKMIVPGAMTGPSYWYDQSAALSLSPEDAAVYRSYIERIDWLKQPKMQSVPANNNVMDHPSFRTQKDKDKMDAYALWLQLQALLDEEEKLKP